MNTEAHIASIAQTATEMIAAGELDANNIDWDALRIAHGIRLHRLITKTSDYVVRQVWERANGVSA